MSHHYELTYEVTKSIKMNSLYMRESNILGDKDELKR